MRVLWLLCYSGTPFLLHLSPFLFDFHSVRYGRTKKMGPYTYSSKEAREETVYVWVSRLVFLAHLGESMSGAHYCALLCPSVSVPL
jgi:hypothetical protein